MLVRDKQPNSNHQDFRLSDDAAEYRNNRIRLYAAALSGNWKTAESIFKKNPEFVNSSITDQHQTALHVAAGAKQTDFVRKLVNWRQIDLELQDEKGNTAFCLAVVAGSVPIAKILLNEVSSLAFIRGGQNSIPLFIAVIYGRHEMAQFLFEVTKNHLNNLEPGDVRETFFTCIQTDMFDIALKLLAMDENFAKERQTQQGKTALHMLAEKTPTTFYRRRPGKRPINLWKEPEDNEALKLLKKLWQIFLNGTENVIEEIGSPFNLLFEAAKLGNSEYLGALLGRSPELIWETDHMNRTIFHIAVIHRQLDIFNQIYNIGLIKDVVVTYKISREASEGSDNMLHLAAKLPSPHELNVVSGTALQMQRELLWFQVIESMMLPSDREAKGTKEMTPRELFSNEHADLLKKGEKWMRETSHSCMIVATLTAGGVYAAGFSTTTSSNDSKELPHHTLFHVLAVSEAVALSFSIISTLMFLYILTSRYAENDFLRRLPIKLIVGLLTLFISMVAMIVAFGSAFFIVYRDLYYHHHSRCVPLIVSCFVCLPVAFFVLVRSLLRDVFYSTFRSQSLFRPKKSMFVI